MIIISNYFDFVKAVRKNFFILSAFFVEIIQNIVQPRHSGKQKNLSLFELYSLVVRAAYTDDFVVRMPALYTQRIDYRKSLFIIFYFSREHNEESAIKQGAEP